MITPSVGKPILLRDVDCVENGLLDSREGRLARYQGHFLLSRDDAGRPEADTAYGDYDWASKEFQQDIDEEHTTVIKLRDTLVTHGLIDIQINGAFGFDFSYFESASKYVKGLKEVAGKLPSTGVVAFVPTLFSSDARTYHKVLPLLQKMKEDGNKGAQVLGWHAEGPFLNPERRGAHSLENIEAALSGLDTNDEVAVWRRFEEVYGSKNLEPVAGKLETRSHHYYTPLTDLYSPGLVIKIITLAPELFSDRVASAIIARLNAAGIIVAIGHSSCSGQQAENAIAAGVKLVTHLFNAMPGLHHRDPGLVQRSLSREGGVSFSMIADGVHVADPVISLAFTANHRRCILITDALPLLHDKQHELPDGVYEWKGGSARSPRKLRKKGAELYLHREDVDGGGTTLAGSCLPLCEHVARVARVAPHLDMGYASYAASVNVLRLFGCHDLIEGGPGDLCMWSSKYVDRRREWTLEQTWTRGTQWWVRTQTPPPTATLPLDSPQVGSSNKRKRRDTATRASSSRTRRGK